MVIWNCSKSRWKWYIGTAARADRDGIFELKQGQRKIYFENAARADGNGLYVTEQDDNLELKQDLIDGILELQLELIDMLFWNCNKSRWRYYFEIAARADGDNIL